MNLDEVSKGLSYKIISLPRSSLRLEILRFGITEGQKIKCVNVIPGGPVIISLNQQEIAIGRNLARKIIVQQL